MSAYRCYLHCVNVPDGGSCPRCDQLFPQVAPAEPVHQPVATEDERVKFEAFFVESRRGNGRRKAEHLLDRLPSGDYVNDSTQRHWWTWQNAAAHHPHREDEGEGTDGVQEVDRG